tara:strand:- start:97 stop:495 length:399 start_codon:yes stop_codon:yes gene_type:complete
MANTTNYYDKNLPRKELLQELETWELKFHERVEEQVAEDTESKEAQLEKLTEYSEQRLKEKEAELKELVTLSLEKVLVSLVSEDEDGIVANSLFRRFNTKMLIMFCPRKLVVNTAQYHAEKLLDIINEGWEL